MYQERQLFRKALDNIVKSITHIGIIPLSSHLSKNPHETWFLTVKQNIAFFTLRVNIKNSHIDKNF